MASSPLLAVLMLGDLGFAPWQYGLAFAVPCAGGLVGARLSRRLVARYGQRKVLLTAGTLRSCRPLGLVLIGPGLPGMALVMAVELGLITCAGIDQSFQGRQSVVSSSMPKCSRRTASPNFQVSLCR